MNKCPNCGAPIWKGFASRFQCGSKFEKVRGVLFESKKCLRNQVAQLKAKLEERDA